MLGTLTLEGSSQHRDGTCDILACEAEALGDELTHDLADLLGRDLAGKLKPAPPRG